MWAQPTISYTVKFRLIIPSAIISSCTSPDYSQSKFDPIFPQLFVDWIMLDHVGSQDPHITGFHGMPWRTMACVPTGHPIQPKHRGRSSRRGSARCTSARRPSRFASDRCARSLKPWPGWSIHLAALHDAGILLVYCWFCAVGESFSMLGTLDVT